MWTLAISPLILCFAGVFTSTEAVAPTCAPCTYNATSDTDCSVLKTFLNCLESKSCALSHEDSLEIQKANCPPDLPAACNCQKAYWGDNSTVTDKCKALTTYTTCLNASSVDQNSTCEAGVNVSTLLATAKTSLAGCNDQCKNQNCSGHGNCVLEAATLPAKFSCKCNDSYEGDLCQNEKTACSPRPCQHGGKCNVTTDGNYTCACTSGYSGSSCDEGPCIDHKCGVHGQCKADEKNKTKAVCDCEENFWGEKCTNNAGASREISLLSFLATLLVASIIRMTLT